jgi:hypothetical protein
MIIFFMWMYFAIVKVWRRSLKVLSIFWGLAILFNVYFYIILLTFAAMNLSSLFSTLAIATTSFLILTSVKICTDLWTISRSADTASFRATLDSRLVTGMWTYINKFMDLPRTPFKSLGALSAYALAFAGAVLQITCIMFILSGGTVGGTLTVLFKICEDHVTSSCRATSESAALAALLWLPLAGIGLQAAGLMQSLAKKIGGASVSDSLRESKRGFILYLRPFLSDTVILPKPALSSLSRLVELRPFPVRIEEELFDVADGYRNLVAIGDPKDDKRRASGLAVREYLDDAKWQSAVAERIESAQKIVLVIDDTEGVVWEMRRIIGSGAWRKTLFIFHPSAKTHETWERLSEMTLREFKIASLLERDFTMASSTLAFYFDQSGVVQILNKNWSTTSYRTAFSHFLAEQKPPTNILR